MLYFDSNYILKCYLPEPEAHRVRELARQPVAKCCSAWGRIEFITALHRKLREHSLTRATLKALWARFVSDGASGVWTWLPFDEPVQTAIAKNLLNLSAAVLIRAGDAVHLATAALHGFTEIYSHDRHLLNAASEFGLKGADILS